MLHAIHNVGMLLFGQVVCYYVGRLCSLARVCVILSVGLFFDQIMCYFVGRYAV